MRAANQKPLQTSTRQRAGEYGLFEAVHEADLDEYGNHTYYFFRYASLRAYLLYS